MGLFRNTPTAEQLVPALTNLSKNVTDLAGLRNNQHPRRLAGFVLASTSSTMAVLLGAWPEGRKQFRGMVKQCRHHFDGAWWLYQRIIRADEEKISLLFPLVDFELRGLVKHLRYGAPTVEPILRPMTAVNGAAVRRAHQQYVRGDLPPGLIHLRDLEVRACNASLLAAHLFLDAPEKVRRDSFSAVVKHASDCWDNPLLGGFNLDECPILDLPQEWLD